MKGRGALPEVTTRRLEQKPDPSPIRSSRPSKSHNPDGQNTKEKPTTERKCFPTKAISSNLYSSNKFTSSFRCHYSKVTGCLLTRKKLLSFFNDLLVNIYRRSLAFHPFSLNLRCQAPRPVKVDLGLVVVRAFTWVHEFALLTSEIL